MSSWRPSESTDAQGRIRSADVSARDELTLVCTQAGNVNSGSFDPFDDICDAALNAKAWIQIDGALGLWAATSPSLARW